MSFITVTKIQRHDVDLHKLKNSLKKTSKRIEYDKLKQISINRIKSTLLIKKKKYEKKNKMKTKKKRLKNSLKKTTERK